MLTTLYSPVYEDEQLEVKATLSYGAQGRPMVYTDIGPVNLYVPLNVARQLRDALTAILTTAQEA